MAAKHPAAHADDNGLLGYWGQLLMMLDGLRH